MNMYWEGLAIVSISVLALAVFLIGYIYLTPKKSRKPLMRPKFEKNKVYLVQFPVSPHVRSISPFSLKVESWLRLHKIKYENVHTFRFGSKGQIPYVELNGKEIPDSNMIIERLEEHFGIDAFPKEVTLEQRASAHAFTVMLENQTAVAGFYWRYGRNMRAFCSVACGYFPAKLLKFWTSFQPFMTRFKTYMHGLGRHEDDEIADFSCQDLRAISDYLGEKDFILGGTEPTRADCTVFGHLAQFVYIPVPFPQQAYLQANCSNVIKYLDRVRDRLWPDWEFACSRHSMDRFMGKDYEDAMKKEKRA